VPFRIAHVGAGEWSRYAHGPTLSRLAERSIVSLELICDLQIERAHQFQAQFHYREASSDLHKSLIAVHPDAIVCTVQPAATAQLVQSLLPLRIPLFIEKPPGISLAEACSLASAAVRHRTFSFVAFNRRSIPAIVHLKEWVRQHPVRFARAEMLRTNRIEEHFAINTGIHALDTMRYLLGNPESMVVSSRTHPHSSACDSLVQLHYAGATVGEIALMLHTGLRRETYRIISDGASAEVTLGSSYSSDLCRPGELRWSGEAIVEQRPISDDALIDGGFLGEYEAFFHSLEHGSESRCSLSDAAFSMQLAEAVQNNYSGKLAPLAFS
jgi:myo-inositol 2-dehydrogenase / D-chiro-inositol 1-dehydrogenase